MASIIPTQIRTLDPYADHRFSNTINRLVNVVSGTSNVLLPFDVTGSNNPPFTVINSSSSGDSTTNGFVQSWNAYESVRITGGLLIKDSILIHIPAETRLSFKQSFNYVGSGTDYNTPLVAPPTAPAKYFILLQYTYSRSYPAPAATFVIAKERNEFLLNRDKYMYIATANIVDSGTYKISSISYTDTDETNGDALIERPFYKFPVVEIDGGNLG